MKLNTKKIVTLSLFAAVMLQSNLSAQMNDKESLGSVDVISSNVTEGTGSYTIDYMNSSTKLDLSIKHTPQSVAVLTSQTLEDMGIFSYQEMLGHVAGVSIKRWDERLNASARGFELDYFKVDGMPSYSTVNERDLDLEIYDRVEIVRGANGLTTGAGNPGISINLVRKRANSKDFTGEVKLETGSWNKYGLSADIGSKLNESGSIRGRTILKYEKKDSYMDGYERENKLFYTVIDADITDTTRFSGGFSYQDLNRHGVRWGGLPALYSDGSRTNFDRSDIISEDWTKMDNEVKSIFFNLDQVLYDDINLNFAYTHNRVENDVALLYFGSIPSGAPFFGSGLDKNTGAGLYAVDFIADEERREDNLDLDVNIPFELGGLSQEIVIGASYNREKVKDYTGRYPNNAPLVLGGRQIIPNYFNYDLAYPQANALDIPFSQGPNETKQKAIYLAGKFSLREDLKLITGARVSSWEFTSQEANVDDRKFSNEFTPYVGLVYDIDQNHSIYTSYTSIFKPQDKQTVSGDFIDPVEGESFEAGIKGEYFDGNLNASLTFFRIEQDKAAQLVGGGVKVSTNPTKDAYKTVDGVTSRGFEFDISGKITDNLNLNLGIARFLAEDGDGKEFNTDASRTTATAYATYKLNDFTLGGGIQYKSSFYSTDKLFNRGRITQDAYIVANAMTAYKINKNTNLQLNVKNLFDKKYYEGVGNNGMSYGEPRNFNLSLSYKF